MFMKLFEICETILKSQQTRFNETNKMNCDLTMILILN